MVCGESAGPWWGRGGLGLALNMGGGGQEVFCFPSQSRREPVLQSCVMTQKEGQCLVGAEAE